MALTAKQLLAASDRATKTLPIPAWGGDVVIGTISKALARAIIRECVNDKGEPDYEMRERRYLQACLVEPQITQAQADADARVAQARAQAEATRMAGEAEASAIRAKGEALSAYPELIALTTAEAWNGMLPTTMVPDATVPFIELRR